jgi:hypothetical protein
MPCDHGRQGVHNSGQTRRRPRMAQKAAEPTSHATEGIWGSPPHLEGSFPYTDPRAVPTENLGICHQYHKRVENGLVEPSPEAHQPDELYIAMTLVRDRREVPVRVLNATHRDQ